MPSKNNLNVIQQQYQGRSPSTQSKPLQSSEKKNTTKRSLKSHSYICWVSIIPFSLIYFWDFRESPGVCISICIAYIYIYQCVCFIKSLIFSTSYSARLILWSHTSPVSPQYSNSMQRQTLCKPVTYLYLGNTHDWVFQAYMLNCGKRWNTHLPS